MHFIYFSGYTRIIIIALFYVVIFVNNTIG